MKAPAIALLAALALAAGASAGDALLRPGRGMAGVDLGMSRAQVVQALGKPQAVVTRKTGFGRRTVELQFGYGSYFVLLSGSSGRERVVKVLTTFRRERTAGGIGVGVTERRLLSTYGARLACQSLSFRDATGRTRNRTTRYCVLGDAGDAQTVFMSQTPLVPLGWGQRYSDWRLAKIAMVVIRAPNAPHEPGEDER